MQSNRGAEIFISHSSEDYAVAQNLCELLERRGIAVWIAPRDVLPGSHFAEEALSAIEQTRATIVLLSEHSNTSLWVRNEVERAVSKRKLILTVRIRNVPPSRSLELYLSSSQWIDASTQPLVRAVDQIVAALNTLSLREERAAGAGFVSRLPSEPSNAEPRPGLTLATSKLPITNETLVGRNPELQQLNRAWGEHDCHLLVVIAWGGVGKSALINTWRAQLAADHWRGAEQVFGWTFYSQGLRDTASSAAPFIDAALRHFKDPNPSIGSEWEKGQRLADLVRRSRTLLLLDGLEPLQYSPGPQFGRLKDSSLRALLESLAEDNPGLCVITTRYAVTNLAPFLGHTVRTLELQTLSDKDGAELLGTLIGTATEEQLQQASAEFDGHPLALNLLGTYVRDCWGGDLDRCLKLSELHLGSYRKLEAPLLDATQGYQAERVMASYDRALQTPAERALLRVIGLFDRIATADEITCVRESPAITGLTESLVNLPQLKWQQVISNLRRARLVAPQDPADPAAIDAHPLVREYFGRQLRTETADAWQAAHSRLFDYWSSVAAPEPTTLAGLVPLYAAVSHGCNARKYVEALCVYRERILRDDMFSTRKLGALGADFAALYSFFDTPFSKVTAELPTRDVVFVLRQTGYCLRAQGRLTEAVECLQVALGVERKGNNWRAAAVLAGLISQTHLTAGRLVSAIRLGQQAVEFASRGADAYDLLKQRTALAYMKHQAGRADAEDDFRASDAIRRTLDFSAHPGGSTTERLVLFHYSDFLLGQRQHEVVINLLEALKSLVKAGTEERSRLAVALVQLVLGRAYLRRSEAGDLAALTVAGETLQAAIDGVRQADREDCLPLVLLARSEYRLQSGQVAAAWQDIHEAFRIVERGNMKLYEADAHIAAARAHIAEVPADTTIRSQREAYRSLQTARSLVAAMQYRRRDAELDALDIRLSEVCRSKQ